MDLSLQNFLSRLEHLSDKFHELRSGVQKAIQIADTDPEMALTRARKVLEYVVRDVYERRINEPPGTRPLENLLQRLVKDGFIPDRLDAYATTIRKLGNVGTHGFGETIAVADVYQSLAQLMPILEWYFENERPEALGECAALARQAEPPNSRRAEPATAAGSVVVVPKGLRSFDAHDADFFLDLLPGPCDKDGLPESIRFWKHRIESADEAAFTVGVIYGPSGCGKSSLVKAGLLPRLGRDVLPIYIEATAIETEARLLKALRSRFASLPADASLTEAVATLRRGSGVKRGQKVLIVIDQFEQWLHARRGEQNTELAQALRQCDGQEVQCLLLVRDDFWLALSRFMADLHVELVQGQNIVLVDLFDPLHARCVLEAFGRALGRLPAKPSKEAQTFVEQAIRGLTQDGRVISVRLALFAEMVKGRPWTPATLKAVGGTEGIGVSFLEETFSSANAPPERRYHQKATRLILKALLPESGTDIKGHMRSHAELLALSGYAGQPREFDNLIRILDGEVRLITPTDPDGREDADRTSSAMSAGEKCFQLTHDYLIHSLRDWLTRKQRETRRGRAELRLAGRASLWTSKPENRYLPSLWEGIGFRLLTDRRQWTESQARMLAKAGRVHAIRAGIAAAVLFAACLIGLRIRSAVVERQNATRAEDLVDELMRANIGQVPAIVSDLVTYRAWAEPLLKVDWQQAKEASAGRLNLSLALLPVDPTQITYLSDQLLVVTPQQFPIVRDALAPHKLELLEKLWGVAEQDSQGREQQQLRAAAALAAYDPEDPRWTDVQEHIADDLVKVPAVYLAIWMDALRPVRGKLLVPLAADFRDPKRPQSERSLATDILADYAADRPDVLFQLLASSEPFQFPAIYARLSAYKERAIGLAQMDLAKPLPASEEDKEAFAQRQANAAVALVKLGAAERVWELLKGPSLVERSSLRSQESARQTGTVPRAARRISFSSTESAEQTEPPRSAQARNEFRSADAGWDLRVRSRIIHLISRLGGDPRTIINRLDEEPDVTIRRALVLTVGEFSDVQLPAAERQPLVEKLLTVFENEPDPGLHAAAEWLLRRWKQGDRVQGVLDKLTPKRAPWRGPADPSAGLGQRGRPWFINSLGQTFVILDAGEFPMGSPAAEPFRGADESRHRVHIGRCIAIATTHVTRAQYRTFRQTLNGSEFADNEKLKNLVRGSDDSPQTTVTWYEAAHYCNWLSQREGLPECYAPNDKGEYGPGMHAKDHYLELAGYRLPTEAEWEFACRACTVTSRYFGGSESLLPDYACYLADSQNHIWPVASLKPNDFGLFDMHGDAWQWCDTTYQNYPNQAEAISEDLGSTEPVVDTELRVLRGGSFNYPPSFVRAAGRINLVPTYSNINIGFRPVRTYLEAAVASTKTPAR
jgi:formylglycine-generating enzyme required for sulfatase activity